MDNNRGWQLGQQSTGPSWDIVSRRRCRCGNLRVVIVDCDNTTGGATVRGTTPTSIPTPSLTPNVTATLEVPCVRSGIPRELGRIFCICYNAPCNFSDRIGKIRWAVPSALGTCPGSTYSAYQSTCKGSGTTNACWASCTLRTLPVLFALLCALASALRRRVGTKDPTKT